MLSCQAFIMISETYVSAKINNRQRRQRKWLGWLPQAIRGFVVFPQRQEYPIVEA